MQPASASRLGAFVWVLAALGGCTREAPASSNDGEWFGDAGRSAPPEIESGSFCAEFVRRAEQCGVIGGDYRACVNYGDAAERCELQCLQRADCSFFERLLCAGERPLHWPANSSDAGLDTGADAGARAMNDARAPSGAADSVSATRRCFEECIGLQPFRCDDGRWVSAEARCDFVEHCDDGEDETGCTRCADGVLVERGDVCPTLSSCGEGCAECDGGTCQRHTEWGKPSPRFKCRNSDQYIRQDWVCNQRQDCDDGSDEADCDVLGRCQNRLISRWEYCNGVDDCGTGAAVTPGGSFDEPPWCPPVEVAACLAE